MRRLLFLFILIFALSINALCADVVMKVATVNTIVPGIETEYLNFPDTQPRVLDGEVYIPVSTLDQIPFLSSTSYKDGVLLFIAAFGGSGEIVVKMELDQEKVVAYATDGLYDLGLELGLEGEGAEVVFNNFDKLLPKYANNDESFSSKATLKTVNIIPNFDPMISRIQKPEGVVVFPLSILTRFNETSVEFDKETNTMLIKYMQS